MKLEIDIDIELVKQALESSFASHTFGVGYWANVSDWDRENYTCTIGISEPETPDEERFTYEMDIKKVKQGLITMARICPDGFASILTDRIDGPTGDLLVQCIVFGKIKYG